MLQVTNLAEGEKWGQRDHTENGQSIQYIGKESPYLVVFLHLRLKFIIYNISKNERVLESETPTTTERREQDFSTLSQRNRNMARVYLSGKGISKSREHVSACTGTTAADIGDAQDRM